MKASFSTVDTKLKAKFGTVNEVTKTVEVPVTGSTDYNDLTNKPKINTVELKGDKSFEDLGLQRITNREIEAMFD